MPAQNDPEPYFRIHLFCCTNVRPDNHPRGSCGAKGSAAFRDYLSAKVKETGLKGVRINASGCLDRCELGPVMVIYPEAVWYSYRTYEDIDEILTRHIIGGKRVERLMLRSEDGPPSP